MRDKAAFDDNWLFPSLFFLLTIITRVPFTSKLLYHMDSVQFALALGKYDITTHQPHPPGYFLYVMLGRFVNFFIGDANAAFVSISVIFSGLTVVAVYYLGKELFDKKIGILAGILALTSPNIWFHGEVALSYIVEAFFSTVVALICWRLYKGEHKYIWLSAIILGISGGIRQNTIVFLLPLWLFSIKETPIRKSIASIGLLGIVCLLWFVPMIWMTGGMDAYMNAFKDLFSFIGGLNPVYKGGWPTFKFYCTIMFNFVIFGLGIGIIFLIFGLGLYLIFRKRNFKVLDRPKIMFFSSWLLPAFLFYILVAIHPGVPGFILILLPALFLLTAWAMVYIVTEVNKLVKWDILIPLTLILVIVNVYFFIFFKSPVSYAAIREHDRDLPIVLDRLKAFDPSTTVLLVSQNLMYYGLTHVVYYLPQYIVYDPDFVLRTGHPRQRWAGYNQQAFFADDMIAEEHKSYFATLLISDDRNMIVKANGLSIAQPLPLFYIISGPLLQAKKVYPGLPIRALLHKE